MPKIYVTRHGQSMTNIDADIRRREQGLPVTLNTVNNILTETGIYEAMIFAHNLKRDGVEIGHIVCSPFGRTKQTAFCIASVLANLAPISYDERIQEIAWDVGGEFDRLENYIEGFDSKNLRYDERPMIDHRRGAFTLESQLDVYNRAIPAFFEYAAMAKDQNRDILLVTHFFVVRSIMAFMDKGCAGEHMNDYSPLNLCQLSYDVDEVLNRVWEVIRVKTAAMSARWSFEPVIADMTDDQIVYELNKALDAAKAERPVDDDAGPLIAGTPVAEFMAEQLRKTIERVDKLAENAKYGSLIGDAGDEMTYKLVQPEADGENPEEMLLDALNKARDR